MRTFGLSLFLSLSLSFFLSLSLSLSLTHSLFRRINPLCVNLILRQRTLLAWVRTIITAVGFGLLLARFYTADKQQGQVVLFCVCFIGGLLMALGKKP